jgi:hypothetical protein
MIDLFFTVAAVTMTTARVPVVDVTVTGMEAMVVTRADTDVADTAVADTAVADTEEATKATTKKDTTN